MDYATVEIYNLSGLPRWGSIRTNIRTSERDLDVCKDVLMFFSPLESVRILKF